MTFPPSALATRLLTGLKGIEIGGSAQNSFQLDTINVDWTADPDTACKREEIKQCGRCLKVDVVADGAALPFENGQWDFVVTSHCLEHNFDTIGAFKEWLRVVKPGGIVFTIFPHPDRTPDKGRKRTTLNELIDRHSGKIPLPSKRNPEWAEWALEKGNYYDAHHTVWNLEDAIECVKHIGGCELIATQDPDDKVGNGFTFVVRKL